MYQHKSNYIFEKTNFCAVSQMTKNKKVCHNELLFQTELEQNKKNNLSARINHKIAIGCLVKVVLKF